MDAEGMQKVLLELKSLSMNVARLRVSIDELQTRMDDLIYAIRLEDYEEEEEAEMKPKTAPLSKETDIPSHDRTCCHCGVMLPQSPPGPPDPPPWSCGKPECEKERQRRINRIVG